MRMVKLLHGQCFIQELAGLIRRSVQSIL
jgi:hypothetical protein